MAFKKGDQVQFKTKGPQMVVLDPESGVGILCGWFSGSKYEKAYFPPEALMPASDPDSKKK